jgi:hypothetical protein
MTTLKATVSIASLSVALLLAGCGGGSTDGHGQQAAQGVAIGEPSPVPVAADFIQLAQQQSCADIRNRLFVIDGKEVFWDRAGSCPDNAATQRLYGANPQTILCETSDTLAGPHTFCANDEVRKLFETIQQNVDAPGLGLDSTHKVQYIPFLPKSGTAIAFQTLVADMRSGVTEPKNVVVRDPAAWQQLWNQHIANRVPAPGLPNVDFTAKMVLAVFTGNRAMGCGSMGITHVSSKDGQMVVDYEDRSSPMGRMCPNIVTSPVSMVMVDRNDAPVNFQVHQVRLLASEVLDQRVESGVKDARNVVIKDRDALDALWLEYAPIGAPVPDVDFSSQMVIGVFLGTKPNACYGTSIDTVSTDGSRITVRHTDSTPAMGALCGTRYGSSPAELIVLGRSDLPVDFAADNRPLSPALGL